MNRIQFIGQTHSGNHACIDELVQFFDHTIAAYEIVSSVEPLAIQGATDEIHSSLKIKLESSDSSKLKDVVDYINNTIHNHKDIYGKSFIVDAIKNDDTHIELFVRGETI